MDWIPSKTERRQLPKLIARLSSEGSSLTRQLAADGHSHTEDAQRLLEQQVEDVSAEISRREARLAQVERELQALEQHQLEADWVEQTLQRFDQVWEFIVVENRARLVQALVQRVEVNEANDEVTVVLTDLAATVDNTTAEESSGDAAERGRGGDRMSHADGAGDAPEPAADIAAQESSGRPHVIKGKLYRVRRGHGFQFAQKPPPPAPEPVRRPAHVARMLAFAHRLQTAIDRGDYRDRAHLADSQGLTRARITQLLDLTLLAPDIQEQILFLEAVDGVEPMSVRSLRRLVCACEWEMQRRCLLK